MFEGTYSPPIYTDLYNFLDGSQDDIFEDSYDSLPTPSPTAQMPVLRVVDNPRSESKRSWFVAFFCPDPSFPLTKGHPSQATQKVTAPTDCEQ